MLLPYEIHFIATLFPAVEEEELEWLANDIEAHGLYEPITLFEGKILDGRARAEACQMCGVPIDIRHFNGSELDAIAYARSKNLIRRQVTPEQANLSTKYLFDLRGRVIQRRHPRHIRGGTPRITKWLPRQKKTTLERGTS
jgi:ParB-like chromosome segregation protein Spo0J